MLNLRKLLVAVFAVGSLLCACTASAKAQMYSNDAKWNNIWKNKPCAEPLISWVLMTFEGHSQGGVDCDPGNYPGFRAFTTEGQMADALKAYRARMSRQGVTIGPIQVAGNGHTIQTLSLNGAPVVDVDFGRILLNGGSSVISNDGATLIGHDGASVIAQGGGNFYGIKAAGDQVIQFPGKWVKVSHPAAAAPPPARPYAPPTAPAVRNDTDVQICVNNTVNQIRRMDGGANHINLQVGAGTAYLTGNILNASYRNTLTSAATSCGARSVNTNNLRVGR